MRRGSITVMMSLILVLITALLCTSIESVQTACARSFMADSMDTGLYSLFAEYDKDLLDHYDLFYLDGGYRSGDLKLDHMVQRVESAVYGAAVKQTAITGYSLATDLDGALFKEQIIMQEKETLGAQGISYLLNQVQTSRDIIKDQVDKEEELKDSGSMNDYDRKIQESKMQEEQQAQQEELQPEKPQPEEITVNPIEVIREIKKAGILGLVIKDTKQLSEKELPADGLLSKRGLRQGLNSREVQENIDSATNNVLYGEYLLQKFGSWDRQITEGDLDYQVEYMIGGEKTDIGNLKKIVNQLLLIREASNCIHIYTNTAKRAQTAALSGSIAASVGIPLAAQIVENVLILCWAYAESLLDVRNLLDGGNAPLTKNSDSWQLSLEKLPQILEMLKKPQHENNTKLGLDYRGYLRILLFMSAGSEQTLRTMDMVECNIRQLEGRETFFFDQCIEDLEMEILAYGPGGKEWRMVRSYGYNM